MMAAAVALLIWSTLTIAAPGRWGTGVSEAGCLALALAWCSWAVWRRQEVRVGVPVAAVGAAALFGCAQLLVGTSAYGHVTLVATLHWTGLFAVALVCRQAFAEPGKLDRFLTIFALFASITALYVLVQPYIGPEHLGGLVRARTEDMAGPFQNRNTYASFVELALPVAMWRAIRDRHRAWMWWTAVAVMAASVVGAASRAGSLLVGVEIIAVLAAVRVRRLAPSRKVALAAAQIALLAVAWATLAGWDWLWRRLQFDNPLAYRREIFESAAAMFMERPWAGFGLGAFSSVYPKFATFDVGKLVNFAHNDWLQWAAEGGIPMVVLSLLLAGWCLKHMWRHTWAIGLGFVFLHGLVDFPMQRVGLAAWVFVMAAAVDAAGECTRTPVHPKTSR